MGQGAHTAKPIGLIVPPTKAEIPPDATRMYPHAAFIADGLGLGRMAPDAFAAAITRVGDCAARLAGRGACAVFLFGTSLSFFRGPGGEADIVTAIAQASGLPSQTLAGALCDSLMRLRVRRFAAVTAYTPEVDALFRAYFEAADFEIPALRGMDISALDDVERVGDAAISALAEQAMGEAEGIDALVISCAGLRTADIAPALERRFGVPVLSSAMVAAHAAVSLAGGDATAAGLGRAYA